jgi:hypothetical protein
VNYTFQQANADFVTDFLVIGGDLDQDTDLAVEQAVELADIAGVTHVLDVRLEMQDKELWAYLPTSPTGGTEWTTPVRSCPTTGGTT